VDKGHSLPQQTVRRAHYLRVFLRSLINANLDMARRVLSPPLPIYDLFDFLANEETRRKREPEQIHYKTAHSGCAWNGRVPDTG
jgi:hypothetical protein